MRDPNDEEEEEEFVSVMEVTDLTLLSVLESILDGAEIPYRARGEGLMQILPTGPLAAGPSLRRAAVRLEVPRTREEEARALLKEAEPPDEAEAPGGA